MKMNRYSILPLISAVIGFALGTIVLLRDRKKKTNILFFILCTHISIWYAGLSIILSCKNEIIYKLFAIIGLSSINFIIIPYLLYIFEMLKIKNNKLILIYSIIAILNFYLLVDPRLTFKYYFSGKKIYSWGTYPIAGLGETINMIMTAGAVIGCIIYYIIKLIKIKKYVSSTEYTRLKYVSIAMTLFGLCAIDYMPKFGIGIYPFGCIFFLCFASIITYSILKHNLMDIHIVFQKGIIYSILITIITILYFSLILISENVFRGFIGYKSIPLTVAVITIFILLLQPLKNKIQYILDKYFFRGTIDQIQQENIRLREELQRSEKLKAVGTLAAGMAHEIKNPLTSIKTFTEYLPKKYQDKEYIDKFQRIVSSEVNKIDTIVSQLLDFAKPRPLELKESNIKDLIDEILEFLNNDLIKYRIQVVKNYNITPLLKIDPMQMKQVFLNVILNAIDAMKEKGGILTVEISKSEPDFTEISIKDTGYGINKKDLKHIFDPFFTTKETSTGLGLSIVHGIIEKHNGRISVESQLGNGSKFTIFLPLH